ncbi:hypothetical protein HY639_05655 [Candidatus Woesearchaeota archaeon]|nr:hypothetical protein [Candidatus Woesearchaeota archaeon]
MKKPRKSITEYKQQVNTVAKDVLYWMTLLILIIATLVLSIVLIPLILVLEPVPLYTLVLLLGVTFGAVFALLIRDIQGLRLHHHVLALLFLPTISLINLLVVFTIATKAAALLQIPLTADPVILAVVYAVALLLPYLLTRK